MPRLFQSARKLYQAARHQVRDIARARGVVILQQHGWGGKTVHVALEYHQDIHLWAHCWTCMHESIEVIPKMAAPQCQNGPIFLVTPAQSERRGSCEGGQFPEGGTTNGVFVFRRTSVENSPRKQRARMEWAGSCGMEPVGPTDVVPSNWGEVNCASDPGNTAQQIGQIQSLT